MFRAFHSLKAPQLKEKCKRVGISCNGTKAALEEMLVDAISRIADGPRNKRILCLDLGFKNFALASLALDALSSPTLLSWNVEDLNLNDGAFSLEKASLPVLSLLRRYVTSDNIDEVYIESQTWSRNCGRFGQIPKRILNLKSLEALVYGILVTNPRLKVFQSSPRLVSELFGTSADSYTQKKANAKLKVEEKLASQEVNCTNLQVEFYRSFSKKDDLADALLIGLAVNHWWKNGLDELKAVYLSTTVIEID